MQSINFTQRASKAAEEYDRKEWKKNEAAFYPTDIQDIYNHSKYKDISDLMAEALKAGFMMGYKKGLRDARKKAEPKQNRA